MFLFSLPKISQACDRNIIFGDFISYMEVASHNLQCGEFILLVFGVQELSKLEKFKNMQIL